MKKLVLVTVGGALLAAVAVATLLSVEARGHRPARLVPASDPVPDDRLVEISKGLTKLQPKSPYVVVDTVGNRLAVVADGTVERIAACSTGSGTTLRDPQTGQVWVFETPIGVHKVRNKRRDPVWVKPDWAFIEEGLRPPRRRSERFDDVSLGDYALDLGDGYLIHGTLFQSLLGRGVTHGCIRLGDADLEYVFRRIPVGTTVFIY
jgi:L,D-transpeptidase YbiS